MNENHAVLGVLAVVLVIGIAGLYMTLNEPSLSITGASLTQAPGATNTFTPTGAITELDGDIICTVQIGQDESDASEEVATSTVVTAGVASANANVPALENGAWPTATTLTETDSNFNCNTDPVFGFQNDGAEATTVNFKLNLGSYPSPFDGSEAYLDNAASTPGDITTTYVSPATAVTIGTSDTAIGTNWQTGGIFYLALNYLINPVDGRATDGAVALNYLVTIVI